MKYDIMRMNEEGEADRQAQEDYAVNEAVRKTTARVEKETAKKVAKKMIDAGMDKESISEATGLSIDEINKII